MVELQVFISCGSEVKPLRLLAGRVLEALERSFLWGLDISVAIRNWNYEDEPPEVVALGRFSARSLRMVDSSSAVVGILGPSVPPVTSEEILRAITRYATGKADNVWLFLASGTKSDDHRRFLRKIKRKTKMIAVYQEFDGDLDLQEKLFVALTPYVIRKAILERQTPVEAAAGGVA